MDTEQKILYQIHCRYNYYLSVKFKLSEMYCGHMLNKKQINPDVIDLFLEMLKKINFPNPEKTQEYIYDFVSENIDNDEELSKMLQRFKKKLLIK